MASSRLSGVGLLIQRATCWIAWLTVAPSSLITSSVCRRFEATLRRSARLAAPRQYGQFSYFPKFFTLNIE
jgi:hypothetical protein